MTKKTFLLLIAVWALCLSLSAKDVILGEKINLEKVTKISELLDKPESFLNKTVRVEGYIVDGCMHKGRWIAVASDKDMQKLEVWDKEGTITFPLDHKGKYAILEGMIYPKQLTQEQAEEWLKHLAGTHQQDVDLSKAKGGMTIYRFDPIGVVIKESK